MHESNHSNEPEISGEQIIQGLREARWIMAEARSSQVLRRELASLDRIDNPDSFLSAHVIAGFPSWQRLTNKNALALEAVGLDVEGIASNPESEGSVAYNDVMLVVSMKEETIKYTLNVIDGVDGRTDDEKVAEFNDWAGRRLTDRFKDSTLHHKIHQAREGNTGHEDAVTIAGFKLMDDPDASIDLLSELSFPGLIQPKFMSDSEARIAIADSLERSNSNVRQQITDDFIKVAWGGDSSNSERVLFVDRKTGDTSITLHRRPEQNYVEKANQSVEYSPAFIDTKCASELADLMAQQKMMFNPALQKEMLRMGDADRYGSAYTQMTREIAKWVNRPGRLAVSNLFVPYDEKFSGVNIVDSYLPGQTYLGAHDEVDKFGMSSVEEKAREAIMQIDASGASEPTRLLIEMAQQAVGRTAYDSDLPVSKVDVSMQLHACFDVASYYIGGSLMPKRMDGVAVKKEKGVPMLEKTYGGETSMLLEPTLFNGVVLPKGSLMAKIEPGGYRQDGDGKWVFLRLTPFTFDSPEDQVATGTEMPKALARDRIIGSVTLDTLVYNAQHRR